jgi:lysophospholipase L1-like esterase
MEKKPADIDTIDISIKGAVIALLVGVSAILIVSEIILRLFTAFPVFEKSGYTIPHEVLGRVVDRNFPEIDIDGFRNPHPPSKPDIVTLGDSMTYGYNVGSDLSWPQQLGKLANRSVYNYGIGGYGPMHYSWLIDKAIEKSPKWVVVGIHLPNDINDVCKVFSFPTYWKEWALRNGVDTSPCGLNISAASPEAATDSDRNLLRELKLAVRRTAVGSAIGSLVIDRLNYSLSRKASPGNVLFVDGRNDTYVSKEFNVYTARNSDLSKPNLQFSADLAERVLVEMNDKAKAQGIVLGIVFIPSKQSVFQRYLEKAGEKLPPEFIQVIENEAILERRFEAHLNKAGIPWVNTRQALIELLAVQTNVYPFRDDDHPLAPGYEAIAKAAQRRFFSNTER